MFEDRHTRMHDRALESDLAIALTERRKRLFGEHIAAGGWIQNNPYSQYMVAKALDVSAPCVCHWETGVTYPGTFGQWSRWARALGMKLKVELE